MMVQSSANNPGEDKSIHDNNNIGAHQSESIKNSEDNDNDLNNKTESQINDR